MIAESNGATVYQLFSGAPCSHCGRSHTIDDAVWQQVGRILTRPQADAVVPDGELAQSAYPSEYTVSIYVRSKLCHILRHPMSHSQALSIGRVLAERDPVIECVVHDGRGKTVGRLRTSVALGAVLGDFEAVQ